VLMLLVQDHTLRISVSSASEHPLSLEYFQSHYSYKVLMSTANNLASASCSTTGLWALSHFSHTARIFLLHSLLSVSPASSLTSLQLVRGRVMGFSFFLLECNPLYNSLALSSLISPGMLTNTCSISVSPRFNLPIPATQPQHCSCPQILHLPGSWPRSGSEVQIFNCRSSSIICWTLI
jgi:hypothetical protein